MTPEVVYYKYYPIFLVSTLGFIYLDEIKGFTTIRLD